MRTVALFVGICIASAAIAQDGEHFPMFPIDLNLEAPNQFSVLTELDDDFLALEWRTVPEAASYIIYQEYVGDNGEMEGVLRLDEAKVDLVRCCTIDGVAGADADDITAIVYAPEGAAEGVWAVSAVLGDVQTPLAWGRLPTTPTAVRSTSWAVVKADR